MKTIGLIFSAILLVGCAGRVSFETQRTHPDVLLPGQTPFDSNPKARTAYLTRYVEGYRLGITGSIGSDCSEAEPYAKAKLQGWSDGQSAGHKDWNEIQSITRKRPNQALEPTTTSVTPPAGQEARQP